MDSVKSLRIFSLVGTLVPAAIVSVMPPPAQAAALTHWNYDPAANQLEVMIQAGATPRYFLMAQPARIVVDLPNTDLGAVRTHQAYSGVIRQIRISQFQPGVTRMVLELSPDAVLAPGQVQLEKVGAATTAGHDRWVLRPLLAQATPISPAVTSPSVIPPTTPTPPLAPPLSTTPQPAPSGDTRAATPEPPHPPAAPEPATITVPPVPLAPAIGDTTAITPITSGMGGSQPMPPVSSATPNPLPTNSGTSPDLAIDTSSGIEIAVPPPGTAISQSSRSEPTTATPTPTSVTVPIPAVTSAPAAAVAPSPSAPASTTSQPLAPPLPSLTSVPLAPPLPTAPTTALPPLAPPLLVNPPVPLAPSLSTTPTALPSTLPNAAGTIAPLVSVPPSRLAGSGNSIAPAPLATPAPRSPNLPQVAQTLADSELPGALPPSQASNNSTTTVTVPPLGQSTSTPTANPSGNAPLPPLPSATVQPSAAPSVNVPPLSTPASTPLPPASVAPPNIVNQPTPQPASLPTATPGGSFAPTVSVPPLQSTPNPLPIAGSSASELMTPPPAASPSVIPFGQPLPSTTSALPPGTINYPNGFGQAVAAPMPGVLLPAGMTLNLVYPGDTALQLQAGTPRQEVLLLQTDLRDANGQIVIPAGSTVFGRFETSSAGSQFIAQAITLQGRNVPIAAQSEPLGGSPKISESRIAINSGIGALAGGLVSQFSGWGLLGGAATGAAVTYFTSPRPAVIQPSQVVPVRVMQDLR